MKKFTLSLLAFSVSLLVFGQKKDKSSGYYYDLDGNKIEGEFVFKPPIESPSPSDPGGQPGKLIFYKGDKKEDKFKAKDISSFVIGDDSVTVIQLLDRGRVSPEFARVYKEGEIILYQLPVDYRTYNQNAEVKVRNGNDVESFKWAYKRKGENEAKIFMGLKRYKKELAKEISDNKELSEEVLNSKNMKLYMNLGSIIERYNAWYEKQN